MSNKINLEFYKNNDIYLCEKLRALDEIMQSNSNDKVDFIDNLIKFYLNKKQNKILYPFDFNKNSDVLEVNASLGVNTKYLCERVNSVTVIEYALNNAKIIADTCRDNNNLEIIVGNPKDIKISKKFDCIIISDSLEAARLFFKDPKSSVDMFIEYFKNLLKPNGIIMFSTDNRYSINNWCGSISEITYEKYDSLQGYPKIEDITTYSKPELEEIFNKHFKYVKFYYPTPHSYSVSQMLTDFSLKFFEYKNITGFRKYFQGKSRFDRVSVIEHLLNIGKFSFFSNSYFIVVSDVKPREELLYSKILATMCTKIGKRDDKIFVEKIPLENIAKQIFDNIYNYYESETKKLKLHNIKNVRLAECKKTQRGSLEFEYVQGERLDLLLYDATKSNDFSKLLEIVSGFKKMVYNLYPDKMMLNFSTKGMENLFGVNSLNNVWCVKNANYDMNFSNVFKDGETYTIIDYDKVCPFYLPIDYIVYKAVCSIKLPCIIEKLSLFNNSELPVYENMVMSYYNNHGINKYINIPRDK